MFYTRPQLFNLVNEKKDCTQTEMAKTLGVSQACISQMLNVKDPRGIGLAIKWLEMNGVEITKGYNIK